MTPWIDSTVTGVERVWQVLDTQVEAGRFPGYVAAVRIRGTEHVRAGGRTALEPASPPMRDDTQFRIASITKPVGAALTLTLVRDGVVALDDPIGRWLPEAAEPRVLVSPDGAARRHGARGAARHRPRSARRHLRLGHRHGADTAAGGDDRARRVRQPAAPRRVGGRVRRTGHEPAARLPAGRGLALRDRHRPARHGADPRHRAVAGRPGRRADHRPARHGVDRVPGHRLQPARHRLHPRARRARRARPAGRHLRRPAAVRGAGFRPGVHRAGRPAVLLRDGRRRRARADGGRGRAHDGGRAHRRAAEVRAGLPRRRRVVGPGHRGRRPRRPSRGRRPAAGAGRAGPGPRRTSTRSAGRSPCS